MYIILCKICLLVKGLMINSLFSLISFRCGRFVFIAMEALDQLLVACHAHTLNLFVESFLKMVQKLMECDEPDLQIRATASVGQKKFFADYKYF